MFGKRILQNIEGWYNYLSNQPSWPIKPSNHIKPHGWKIWAHHLLIARFLHCSLVSFLLGKTLSGIIRHVCWCINVGPKLMILSGSFAGGRFFLLTRQINSWVVVSNVFNFHPYLGKCSDLTSILFKWVGKKTPTKQYACCMLKNRFSFCFGCVQLPNTTQHHPAQLAHCL